LLAALFVFCALCAGCIELANNQSCCEVAHTPGGRIMLLRCAAHNIEIELQQGAQAAVQSH
jgi:hypothetical protein